MVLHVLSAGAAKGLITELEAELIAAAGIAVEMHFATVGATKERFLAGDPCDVLILTEAVIEQLAGQQRLVAGSPAPLGLVRTGIAVPEGAAAADISTVAAFSVALEASGGVYIPDGVRSTAGSHFVNILGLLGIKQQVAPHLKSFDSGEEAMQALAGAAEKNALGCAQMTEIRAIRGLRLAGPLPVGYGLSTVYTAAVNGVSENAEAARRFVTMLTGLESARTRVASGFDDVC